MRRAERLRGAGFTLETASSGLADRASTWRVELRVIASPARHALFL
jgi:hypothetical protein